MEFEMISETIINTTDEKVDLEDIKNICDITLKKENVNSPLYNIIIVDNRMIKEINREYRKIDKETDVISFAFEETDNSINDDVRVLGEVYISIDKAKEQAKDYGHSLKREICFLTVHGLLHTLGYDHIKEEDRIVMRAKEEEILNSYNVSR